MADSRFDRRYSPSQLQPELRAREEEKERRCPLAGNRSSRTFRPDRSQIHSVAQDRTNHPAPAGEITCFEVILSEAKDLGLIGEVSGKNFSAFSAQFLSELSVLRFCLPWALST